MWSFPAAKAELEHAQKLLGSEPTGNPEAPNQAVCSFGKEDRRGISYLVTY